LRPIGLMTKGEQTKELILEKSAELFNLYGYNQASMSDIMDATGLKKGGIYNHFSNKDEIAKAAFERAFEKVIRRFRAKLDLETTSKGKLSAIIDVFQSFYNDPVYKGGCPIYNTAIEATDAYPEIKNRAIDAVSTLHAYIEIKLREGIERGELNKSIDVSEIATFMMTTLEGAIILSRVYNNHVHVDRAVSFVRTYLNDHVFID
jgi:TetR/AcrR family transcriptional repressor of nem operon